MEKKGMKRGTKRFLRIVQHVLISVSVLALVVVITGSNVVIHTMRGNETYNLYEMDRNAEFNESVLFNTIFGKSAAEVVRFNTIRSQMETDGIFDPKKIIDVKAFNSREATLPKEYVTARYYLEDLLRWAENGFENEQTPLTDEEQRLFLSKTTKVTIIDPAKYKQTAGKFYNENIEKYTEEVDVSANMGDGGYYERNDKEVHNILKNRYVTVEGKKIEELVSDWDTYDELVTDVYDAADSLYKNYADYIKYAEYYSSDNSNLRYCVVRNIGGEETYTGNVNLKNIPASGMEAYFSALGSYLYYAPGEQEYKTNTAVEENTFRQMIKKYSYSYPEDVKIWIGVDNNYRVNDEFMQASKRYNDYYPYFYEFIVAAIICILLYLLILVLLTIKEGRPVAEEEDHELYAFDKIPFEWYLVFVILLIACLGAAFAGISEVVSPNSDLLYGVGFKVAATALVFITDIFVLCLYYSLVRRIKAKNLYKDSYLAKILKGGKKFFVRTYDNGSVVLRVWVPAVALIIVNAFLFLCGSVRAFPFMIFVAIIIDLAAAAFVYNEAIKRQQIVRGIEKITDGDFSYQLDVSKMHGDTKVLGEAVNHIGAGIKRAVETSMKDERMKADLITNVSHDIKTPLTSIINYVDLLKREKIEDEKITGYIQVLDEKSQRLKQLTDDLVEASKISSGNIILRMERINVVELINQSIGEFDEKFEEKSLQVVVSNNVQVPHINADSRRIWRVMENLFNNIYKYALPGTRVYVDLFNAGEADDAKVGIAIKNISANSLNCNPDELTERFIRGDVSRTTEGSGLGLSIAKNLTEIQKGTFALKLDGDLFKVEISFPVYKNTGENEIITVNE